MSSKPVWMETWRLCWHENLEPWFERDVPKRADGFIDLTEDGRGEIAAAAPQLLRALLISEAGRHEPGYCEGCFYAGGNSCPIDAALTAAGFPDSKSRDAARETMGIPKFSAR